MPGKHKDLASILNVEKQGKEGVLQQGILRCRRSGLPRSTLACSTPSWPHSGWQDPPDTTLAGMLVLRRVRKLHWFQQASCPGLHHPLLPIVYTTTVYNVYSGVTEGLPHSPQFKVPVSPDLLTGKCNCGLGLDI